MTFWIFVFSDDWMLIGEMQPTVWPWNCQEPFTTAAEPTMSDAVGFAGTTACWTPCNGR